MTQDDRSPRPGTGTAALRAAGEHLERFLDTLPDAAWLKDREGRYLAVNEAFARVLGRPAAELIGRTDHDLFPADVARGHQRSDQQVLDGGQRVTGHEEVWSADVAEPQWWETIKAPYRDAAGDIAGTVGVARNVTERRRAERLREGETLILEMISRGVAQEVILTELVLMIEDQFPSSLGTVLLVDPEGGVLRPAAQGRIPAAFARAVDGLPIGEGWGSCGTAAHRRAPVVVADIATDPLWTAGRELALAHGLRACWSQPVVSGTGALLGTFAVYSPVPRTPTEDELGLLQRAAHLVRIALERLQTERALRESERRYRELVHLSPDAILIHSEGAVVFANAAAERFFRAAAGQLVGRRAAELIQQQSGRLELVRLDGTRFPGEVAAAPCEHGGRDAVQVVVHDLTERVEAEEALRRQALLFATISDGVIITAPDGTIFDWNPGAERIFGYTREEMVGRSASVLHRPGEGEVVVAEVLDALRREGSWSGELTTVRKDGVDVVCETTVLPLRDDAGRVVATVGVNRDVTERRRLEEQLIQAQKMEAVGRLAGGVAHDFNNMLTAIKGFASLLELEAPENSDSSLYLGEVLKAVDQAASLTRQLLAYGRRQTMQPKVLRLNAVIDGAERMLRRLIPANIAIETQLAPELGSVRVDPHQIERVLVNLAVNARDAMPEAGRLVISTGNREVTARQRRIPLPVPPGSYVQLSVRDTGAGMDHTTLAHVFEPFFTTKAPGQGTGLGLATVYGIVQQSGGFVWAESEQGRGSAFHILLPRVGDAQEEDPLTPDQLGRPEGRGVVLVAEDEDPVRMLVRVTLQRAGYQVLEARDGEEALRVLRESGDRLDLLLTDVVMPRMGGPRLARHVLDAHPRVPVVFMSGYAGSALEADGTLALANRFLQKPFEPHQLVEVVRDELRRRAAESPASVG